MAEIDLIKISELPATSTIGDADELAVVQGGATKKVPYSVLKDGAEVTPDTTLSEAGVPADAAAVGAALAQKANQAAVTQALAAKADKSEVTDISGDIAELASVVETKADQTALNQKADRSTTDALRQDLTTLNGIVNQKADKTELNTQIGNVTAELATKANTADVNNLLAAKANVASPVFTGRPQAPTAAKGTATLQLATTAFVQNAIDDKEDKLTFDQAPTQGSTNPVTSGGVWEAIQTDKTLAVEDKAADAKVTGEKITELKDELQAKFGFKRKTNASLFDDDDVYSGTSIARTRRWFVNHVFKAGDVIDDIGYAVSQDSTAAATVYTEIWEENSGTLTKVFSDAKNVKAQTAQTGTVVTYHVVANYTVQQKAYVCFCEAGNRNPIPCTVDSAGNDNVLVSTDVEPTTETLALSSLSTFPTKLIPSITISYTAYVGVNVVTIGDGMDYEEIQDALIAINDDTATNPYTFLLMPKKTPYKPFSMLRNSFTDNYPWSGIRTRNISIIGMDKAHCVIRSDSGSYKLPCGEPLTNGVIKNIMFVMTNDDQDPSATQGGYCLHIDCKPLNDMGYKMLIEDCDFENASGPCVGIGVHANCDLQFMRCHFNTTLSADYNPHEGYRSLVDYGVVYAHTSTATTAPDQNLTMIDCEGVCAEGTKSLRIDKTTQYDPETSSFIYTLIGNVFWNKTLNAAGYAIGGTLTPNPMNFGNNNA